MMCARRRRLKLRRAELGSRWAGNEVGRHHREIDPEIADVFAEIELFGGEGGERHYASQKQRERGTSEP